MVLCLRYVLLLFVLLGLSRTISCEDVETGYSETNFETAASRQLQPTRSGDNIATWGSNVHWQPSNPAQAPQVPQPGQGASAPAEPRVSFKLGDRPPIELPVGSDPHEDGLSRHQQHSLEEREGHEYKAKKALPDWDPSRDTHDLIGRLVPKDSTRSAKQVPSKDQGPTTTPQPKDQGPTNTPQPKMGDSVNQPLKESPTAEGPKSSLPATEAPAKQVEPRGPSSAPEDRPKEVPSQPAQRPMQPEQERDFIREVVKEVVKEIVKEQPGSKDKQAEAPKGSSDSSKQQDKPQDGSADNKQQEAPKQASDSPAASGEQPAKKHHIAKDIRTVKVAPNPPAALQPKHSILGPGERDALLDLVPKYKKGPATDPDLFEGKKFMMEGKHHYEEHRYEGDHEHEGDAEHYHPYPEERPGADEDYYYQRRELPPYESNDGPDAHSEEHDSREADADEQEKEYYHEQQPEGPYTKEEHDEAPYYNDREQEEGEDRGAESHERDDDREYVELPRADDGKDKEPDSSDGYKYHEPYYNKDEHPEPEHDSYDAPEPEPHDRRVYHPRETHDDEEEHYHQEEYDKRPAYKPEHKHDGSFYLPNEPYNTPNETLKTRDNPQDTTKAAPTPAAAGSPGGGQPPVQDAAQSPKQSTRQLPRQEGDRPPQSEDNHGTDSSRKNSLGLGDPDRVFNPWSIQQCSLASSSSYEAKLMTLPDVEAFRGRVSKTCFSLMRSDACGDCCSDETAAAMTISIPVDTKACSIQAVDGIRWTLDDHPIDMSTQWDDGYIVSGLLPLNSEQPMRLCAAFDSTGQALSCSSFEEVIKGSSLKYRVADTNSKCCFQGSSAKRAHYPGDTTFIPSGAADSLAAVEQQHQQLLSKAESLRAAIKGHDTAGAAAALQETNADAVVQQANLPLVWPSTINHPNQVSLNRALYNFKDQGSSPLASAFAAVAAYEGAADGQKQDAATARFSEKALHWCDGRKAAATSKIEGATGEHPSHAGLWSLPEAFSALAGHGAVDEECSASRTASATVEYRGTQLANLDDDCKAIDGASRSSGSSACPRASQLQAVVWAPARKADEADITAIQQHIKEHRAVATVFNYTEDFHNWVRDAHRNARIYTPGVGAGAKRIAGHAVSVIGWDFSSHNPIEHYWIVKDAFPDHGTAFGPQTYKISRAAAHNLGFLAWAGGFAPPATGAAAAAADDVGFDSRERRHVAAQLEGGIDNRASFNVDSSCSSNTVNKACTSFGQMWEAAGGAAKLQPLSQSLAHNLEAVSGYDIACLPRGLHLNLCAKQDNN